MNTAALGNDVHIKLVHGIGGLKGLKNSILQLNGRKIFLKTAAVDRDAAGTFKLSKRVQWRSYDGRWRCMGLSDSCLKNQLESNSSGLLGFMRMAGAGISLQLGHLLTAQAGVRAMPLTASSEEVQGGEHESYRGCPPASPT